MLFTTVFRMLVKKRAYNRARRGTIVFQARLRGYNVRRILAATKVATCYRRYIARKHFRQLLSALVALQCRVRQKQAFRLLSSFKKEQKDVGKLKENNERLKQEMASLRAMLAAQGKASAADAAHAKEMAEKEKLISTLEKRIAELEKDLLKAKATLSELESTLLRQQEESTKDKDQIDKMRRHRPSVSATSTRAPDSPSRRKTQNVGSSALQAQEALSMPDLVNNTNSELLAEHRAKVATLEEELDAERRFRREADGEIIRLRAAINGVVLDENEVNDLLVQKLRTNSVVRSETMSEDSYGRYVLHILKEYSRVSLFRQELIFCPA